MIRRSERTEWSGVMTSNGIAVQNNKNKNMIQEVGHFRGKVISPIHLGNRYPRGNWKQRGYL
jgi:hypothetical protein